MSDHIRDELGLFLTGALDEVEQERVLSHLDLCDDCARELARLQELEESLTRLRRRRRWPLAAAALAAGLAVVLLWPRSLERAPWTSPLRLAGGSVVEALPRATLDVETPRRLKLVSGKARFTVVPGPDPFVVETVRGTATVVGTVFTVEVSEMNAKVPTAAAVVTVAVVSGIVVWKSFEGGPETRIQAGEQGTVRAGALELKASPPSPVASSDKVSSLEKENAALKTQLEQVARKNGELEAKLAALSAPAPVASETVTAPTTTPDAKKADPTKARIVFGPRDRLDKLGKIDWKEAAEAAATTGRLIKDLIAKATAGEPVPPELAQQVSAENAKLIKVALAAAQAFPTHGGANGAYTHPLVLANLMSNQLDLAGLSLDDGQAQAIVQLGNDYDSAYEAAQNGYTDQTLALQKLLDELALKKTFMQSVDGVLNAQQQAAIFDPATKDVYMVDLYSPALMLAQFVQPVGKTTQAALVKSVAKTWTDAWDLGTTDPTSEAQSFVTGLSLQTVPAATVSQFKLDDALAAGRGTLKAMKDLSATLPPDGEAATAIKEATGFVVPRLITK
ncbi:MAG TPA: FecR domain-containing protein [Planctomycetota bacterium]|nr:FecR domain-containing protein [Planctomycetota bacterium]